MNSADTVNVSGLPLEAAPTVQSYTSDIVSLLDADLESVTMIGSVLTTDFIPGVSDINSVLVVKTIDIPLLDKIAGLGKKYGKKGVRSPLIMTRDYIKHSLDVFPIEFLDMKLTHKTIYGTDVFSEINLDNVMLRIQCERDLKAKLIHLTRGYISVSGQKDALLSLICDAYTGFFPLFRAMLHISGFETPRDKAAILKAIGSEYSLSMDCMQEIQVLRGKKGSSPQHENLVRLFRTLLDLTQKLSLIVDDIKL